ncbi:CBS domain-containing protein [Pseudomonas sp. gcc21]|uniref:putative nucleotidyltransferase substrate binding domain-containing protein n=1 Tax=Pseudomonas sp. gcc21 TaxID=2726989 RepID=UPI001451F21B|nr:putative nucleotidyltransferase substrate binding domain-containing protein [Pseudomonas sp. gcc21]QJD60768.1 CBS domain-containing protein [Pseudomonas sp. gcc21]
MTKEEAFSQAGKTAVMQNVHGTMAFLQSYPPFNAMEASHLAWMVEHCQLRFYAKGESIIRPQQGVVQDFYVVKQGLIRGERLVPGQPTPDTTFEIGVGECFPLAALVGERATRTEHIASEDCFCLTLPRVHFVKLFKLSTVFRDFALRGVSSLLDQVNQQAQTQAAEQLGEQYSLETRLDVLATRAPVTCQPDTPVREAVKRMHEASVGSIIITDPGTRPLGIFTLRDLRAMVADGGVGLDAAISEVMTASPFHLSPSHTAFDAAIAMTSRHIAHVCVVRDDELVGVLSERDLFSLQRVDLVHLARTIRQAPDVDALVAMREDIRRLAESMLAHGASSTQITRIITLLNDHTVCRVIELCIEQHGDPAVPFTWLVFGSEGRSEQTLHTDQDNGILFEADSPAQAEQFRTQLLPLADRINHVLARCGFTLCKGNIMANNPELCLSRTEWAERFDRFIRTTTPENLLSSSIYFDFRVIWGDASGAHRLFEAVLDKVASNTLFQNRMAQNALMFRPPIGRFRDFVLARSGAEKDTLDLKTQGLTPFVDGARLLALANGISECNTLERFRQLCDAGVIEPLDAGAYEEAYHFIQLTRMQQHQKQARAGEPFSNRVDPDTLNHLDRRILRESFRQAKRLQSSLALRYQL